MACTFLIEMKSYVNISTLLNGTDKESLVFFSEKLYSSQKNIQSTLKSFMFFILFL